MQKRLYVVASVYLNEREENTLHSKRISPLWIKTFTGLVYIKEEFTNRHQSDYLLLSKLIRRVMHSRISFSLCERIVEGRSKGMQ